MDFSKLFKTFFGKNSTANLIKNPTQVLENKLKLYIATALGGLVVNMIPMFIAMIIVFSPFFIAAERADQIGSSFDCAGVLCDPAEQKFYDKLESVRKQYNDKYNVKINEALILTTINYDLTNTNDMYSSSYICFNGSCLADSEINYNNPNGIIEVLASKMVSQQTVVDTAKRDECFTTCSSDNAACKKACVTDNTKIVYTFDSNKYKSYLINDYIPTNYSNLYSETGEKDVNAAKLAIANVIISNAEDFDISYWKDANSGLIGDSYGKTPITAGIAGNIPASLIAAIDSPLGLQKCVQSSCFGYYNTNSCDTHSGMDIGNNGTHPLIYAVAAGEITAMTNSIENCYPQGGCTGRTITITHNLVIEGEAVKFISRYVHLDRFFNPEWLRMLQRGEKVIVEKGQELGVMGNTGNSSATHLHFELRNSKNQLYNPEQLLAAKSCTMKTYCEAVRSECASR